MRIHGDGTSACAKWRRVDVPDGSPIAANQGYWAKRFSNSSLRPGLHWYSIVAAITAAPSFTGDSASAYNVQPSHVGVVARPPPEFCWWLLSLVVRSGLAYQASSSVTVRRLVHKLASHPNAAREHALPTIGKIPNANDTASAGVFSNLSQAGDARRELCIYVVRPASIITTGPHGDYYQRDLVGQSHSRSHLHRAISRGIDQPSGCGWGPIGISITAVGIHIIRYLIVGSDMVHLRNGQVNILGYRCR